MSMFMSPCPCLYVHVHVSMFMTISMFHVSTPCLHVSMSPCLHVYVSMFLEFRKWKTELKENGQLPFVSCKWKMEMANFRFCAANWNGKRKFVFLVRQTINANWQLLLRQTCLSTVCPVEISLLNVPRFFPGGNYLTTMYLGVLTWWSSHPYCSLSLWRVARGSKLMFLELIHDLFIT